MTGGVTIFNCPTDGVTVTASQGATQVSVTWIEPVATDSLGQLITNIVRSHQPNQLFNVGVTPVTYQFIASSGSQDTCSFTVTVNGENKTYHKAR